MARFDIVFFDVYDTLIDIAGVWDEVRERTTAAVLRSAGGLDARAFQKALRAATMRAAVQPGFRLGRDLLGDALEAACRSLGVAAPRAEQRRIIDEAFLARRPFPEAPAVLAAVRRHYRAGALTNADNDILYACLKRAGLDFDLVVTSEDAQSNKPDPAIFARALALAGVPAQRALVVGDSQNDDLIGARRAGMPVAWVNRRGEALRAPDLKPEVELADLNGLPGFLGIAGD